MKVKLILIFLLYCLSFTNSTAEILNYRKPKAREELTSKIPSASLEEIKTNIPILESPQTISSSIPKPNSPELEKEKKIIPQTAPSDPSRPQAKQSSQFTRPFSQKLVMTISFSSNPEEPHKGVVYSPLEMGSVLSSMEGRVVAIDYMDGYHNYIILEHSNGFFTVYGNLEEVFVAEGQTVKKGVILGNLVKEKGLYFQVNQGKKESRPSQFN